ncbi:MAG: hypothetical protein Q9187_000973, partial [Circinaria calcarea]
FVVDGDWITDHTAPQENDGANNVNNYLLPQDIIKPPSSTGYQSAGIMSGVTPQSTTSKLAGNVPKESSQDLDLPGSFPETPAAETSEFSVNPMPASMGTGNPVRLQPGEKVPDPSTFTSNTVSSTVRDDLSLAKKDEDPQQTFGVNPLPATSGPGNPIHLNPGEKVPHHGEFTSSGVDSAVTQDKESYENSSGAPQLPDVVTPQKERDARGGGMFNLPGLSGNMIPESSLPMGEGTSAERDPGFTIQSAAPHSTTAELAGKVPLEQQGVPEIVQESQAKAGLDPEASANQEAVKEKTQMEKELESKVPEEPPTAEGTGTEESGTPQKKEITGGEVTGMAAGGAKEAAGMAAGGSKEAASMVAGGARAAADMAAGGARAAAGMAAGGATAIAAAVGYANKAESPEQATSLPSRGLPPSVQQAIDEMNKGSAVAPTVPDVVQESFTKAHQSPEAAASEEMVGEKRAMETEFLQHVKTEETRLGATNNGIPIAPAVPDVVQQSIAKAHQSPEAAASAEMVGEKSAMEAEFLKHVKTEEAGVDKANEGIAIAPTVPDIVQQSIAEAHQSPEAATSAEMVGEKSAVEAEILQRVKTEEAIGEPAPAMSAALSESAPAPTMIPSKADLNAPASTSMSQEPGSDAPVATSNAYDKGLDAPAVIPISSARDLEPPPSSSVKSGPGLAAPAAAPATTPAAENAFHQAIDSRDVSPMSRGPTTSSQAQPTVTSGLDSSVAPQISQADPPVTQPKAEEPKTAIPAQASPMSNKNGESSAGVSADKKSKRASGFFGKLKQKFHHKD